MRRTRSSLKIKEMIHAADNSIKESIVILNVGGTLFLTQESTILKYPKSLLAEMLNPTTEQRVVYDSNGHIFIDRNPTYFPYILNHMRKCRYELPTSHEVCAGIMAEAEYYKFDDLAEEIQEIDSTMNPLHLNKVVNDIEKKEEYYWRVGGFCVKTVCETCGGKPKYIYRTFVLHPKTLRWEELSHQEIMEQLTPTKRESEHANAVTLASACLHNIKTFL